MELPAGAFAITPCISVRQELRVAFVADGHAQARKHIGRESVKTRAPTMEFGSRNVDSRCGLLVATAASTKKGVMTHNSDAG